MRNETSLEALLLRAREGDPAALDVLCRRYLPALRDWASGKLPPWARVTKDTDDLVQEAFLHSLARIGQFKPKHEDSLIAYLKVSVVNSIRDEIHRLRRRRIVTHEIPDHPSNGADPLQEILGAESFDRFHEALKRLTSPEREIILAKIQLDLDYEELARHVGKPSPDAARMALKRALQRLAGEMAG